MGCPPFFNPSYNATDLTGPKALEFNDARKHWLRVWHPESVFVIDRWDFYFDKGEHFDGEFRSFLRELSPLTRNVFFVAQVPVTDTGGDEINIRELMSWRMDRTGSFPRIYPDSNEPKRKRAVAIATAAMAEFPNLHILRPDLSFYSDDGSIRWVYGRTSYYADDDHLAEAGAAVVRPLFEKAIEEPTRRKVNHHNESSH